MNGFNHKNTKTHSAKKSRIAILGTLVLTFAVLLFYGFYLSAKHLKVYQYSNSSYFDTVCSIQLCADSEEAFLRAKQIFLDTLKYYDQLLDRHKASDNAIGVYELNRAAGKGQIKIAPELCNLLKIGKDAFLHTNGKVNILLGPITLVWQKFLQSQSSFDTPPDIRLLKNLNTYIDIQNLILQPKLETAYLKCENSQIDVGAIAKGYVLDVIVNKLRKAGFDNFLVDLGGNIYASGENTVKKRPWMVRIANPYLNAKSVPDKFMGKLQSIYQTADEVLVQLKNKAITTSGDYQRYRWCGGVFYHHIIDPETLMPGSKHRAVTVITDTGTAGDILSTALFLSDNKKLADEIDLKFYGEPQAIFYDSDRNEHKIYATDAFIDYVTKP